MRIDRDTYTDFLLADDEYIAQIIAGLPSESPKRILAKSRHESFEDDFDEYNVNFDDDSDFDDDDWDKA